MQETEAEEGNEGQLDLKDLKIGEKNQSVMEPWRFISGAVPPSQYRGCTS